MKYLFSSNHEILRLNFNVSLQINISFFLSSRNNLYFYYILYGEKLTRFISKAIRGSIK